VTRTTTSLWNYVACS